MPAPLLGCLYCHAEGTITQIAARKFAGLGSDFPRLICSRCQSVAWFDEDPTTGDWRIHYRKHGRGPLYQFASVRLGTAGWLKADEALQVSTQTYIHRQRLQQAKRGDLSWLRVNQTLPPSLPSSERVYMVFESVTLYSQQPQSKVDAVVDSGAIYITGANLYLLGRDREWAYPLAQIQQTKFTDSEWQVVLGMTDIQQYFACNPQTHELDPQLAVNVLNALRQSHKNS